jgi:hypothetical protein
MTYQNAFNVMEGVSEGAYDRCRGGILEIEITIPSETVEVEGARYPTTGRPPAPGTMTFPEMKATIKIDWELLPLVNTAGYAMEEEQYAPDLLPYPPDKISVSFS